MGGLACILVVRSTLTFTTVPTDTAELAEFDKQMRKVHYNPEYSQALVNEAHAIARDVAEILETPTNQWTHSDRVKLLAGVNKVCGPYS